MKSRSVLSFALSAAVAMGVMSLCSAGNCYDHVVVLTGTGHGTLRCSADECQSQAYDEAVYEVDVPFGKTATVKVSLTGGSASVNAMSYGAYVQVAEGNTYSLRVSDSCSMTMEASGIVRVWPFCKGKSQCSSSDGIAYTPATSTISYSISVVYEKNGNGEEADDDESYAVEEASTRPRTPPAQDAGGTRNVMFESAKTVIGALYDANGALAGVVQLNVGKKTRKGAVKVSASATLIDGKRISATASTFDVDTSASGTLAFKAPIGNMAFAMDREGNYSLSNDEYAVVASRIGGNLQGDKMAFVMEMSAPPSFDEGWKLLEDALPNRIDLTVTGGKKLDAGKASKVKYQKDAASGEYGLVGLGDETKPNVSSLKLSYMPKTGAFKGSFKVYAVNEGGKTPRIKSYTVAVTGFVVNGVGRGQAVLKKPAGGPWTVTLK